MNAFRHTYVPTQTPIQFIYYTVHSCSSIYLAVLAVVQIFDIVTVNHDHKIFFFFSFTKTTGGLDTPTVSTDLYDIKNLSYCMQERVSREIPEKE